MEITDLLSEIKSLKFSNTSEQDFWKVFLKDIAKLNKSQFSLLLNFKDEQWNLKSSYGFEDFLEHEKEILQIGVTIGTRALKNGFSYEKLRLKWNNSTSLMGVGIKIESIDENLVLFLFIEHENSVLFKNSVARLNILSDIYYSYRKNNSQVTLVNDDTIERKNENSFKDAVEIVSLLIYNKKFLLASMTFVNELATRFNCSKVSIGWKKKEYVQTVAISHRENFIRKTEVVDKLEAVYEECFDQNQEIHYPKLDDTFDITYAHKDYLLENRIKEILSLPLRIDNELIGVVLFEKAKEEFTEEELIILRLITNQVTPILNNLYINDRNIFSKLLYKAKEYLSWWLGVNDTLIKFFVIVISFTIITISVVDMDYKIESLGSISTDNISYISAPFDATVYKVEVHSGDIIKEGKSLLMLDTKELYLKYSEAIADVSRYSIEEQKSRSANKLADMQIAKAKINQSKATQQRIGYYLKQANIKSSIDGIIVEGDQEDLLGKPVSKGDMLFKIAQLSGFYLTLNVSEEYINEFEVGKKGNFVFLGKTAEKIEFIIDKIIPMATVDGSKTNSFVVKAQFLNPPKKWWRPGMSGMAKVNVGERKIIWVFTHKFVDFLRLFFWI
ncbi:MAG: multidrug resistance efflux pump [Sulfurimonas sp.]|jgi:multidrug resistance efflux pump|uniref:efflux RND transporter periplasmic adaptor subunit n=1 Tax=Sulfurimonas sp. TaxID=2022749 RepID=UPI0039E66541